MESWCTHPVYQVSVGMQIHDVLGLNGERKKEQSH